MSFNGSGSLGGSLRRSKLEDSSKLMQLYHRRKRQQEQQLRSQFSVGDIAKNLDISKEAAVVVTSTPIHSKDNSSSKYFEYVL